MGYELMAQFEHCGVNQFMIQFDNAANNLPQTAAAGATTVTQAIEGWERQDSSLYYAVDDIKKNWGTENYEGLGMGLGLLMSQILKFEAPAAVVEVRPTN